MWKIHDKSYYNRKEIEVRYKNMTQGINEFGYSNLVNVIYNRPFNKFLILSRNYSGFHIDRFSK